MNKIFRRLLFMAFTFGWKSRKWADLFFEDMREKTNEFINKIDLDTSKIKIKKHRK
jgi:hypothetical protein